MRLGVPANVTIGPETLTYTRPMKTTMSKRVGILTFHSVQNFGAVVQAWTTPRILLSLGLQPEVIDYRAVGHDVKFRRKGIKRLIPSIGGFRSDRFVRRAIPLSRERFTTHEGVDAYVRAQGFRALLTGSDQVWFRNDFVGFDRTYFLDLGDPQVTDRVSYAPSCGPITDLGPDTEQGRRILATYKAVSVRDANTLALARSLGRADAVEVLDPTLVGDLSPLIGRRPMAEPYMLVTGGMTDEAYALLQEIATKSGLKVIEIGRSCRFADKLHPFVDPQEWVNHIAHASLVASSLFHGCAVAIAFKRPFLALDTAGRGFKLMDMLGRLGLEDRFVPSDRLRMSEMPSDLVTLDYARVNPMIDAKREISINFLRNALLD